MKLEFYCTACDTVITSDEAAHGDLVDCPGCRKRIVVPITPVGPGTIIGGYKVVRKVGAGGMGNVYMAEQTSMKRFVALKVLPPALYQDTSFLERFMGEVRMQGALSHPNIATAFDSGKHNEIYYLVMEFIDGYDLHDLIEKKKRIDERTALKMALKVTAGLNYAYAKHGFIHRDIKPGNIMIDQDAEVKVLDLGVSKSGTPFAGKPSTDEGVIGTPHYMSPEQAHDSSTVDARADIYSLGATIYHLLTGSPPFSGDNLIEVITQQVTAQAAPVRVVSPEVSRPCAALLETMMARDPRDRHADWDAVEKDLQRVLDGEWPLTPCPPEKASMLQRSPEDSAREKGETRSAFRRMAYPSVACIAIAALLILVVAHSGDPTRDGMSPDASRTDPPMVAQPPPGAPPDSTAIVASPPGDASSEDPDLTLRLAKRQDLLDRIEELRKQLDSRPEESEAIRQALQDVLREARRNGMPRLVQEVEAAVIALQEAQIGGAITPFAEKARALHQSLRDGLHTREEIVNSFTNDIGKTITVRLRKGPKRVEISAVENGAIRCLEQVEHGMLVHTYGLNDLSLDEQHMRLQRQSGEAAYLMMGLLALEAGEDELAAGHFADAGGDLGSALEFALDVRGQAQDEAVDVRQPPPRNEEAVDPFQTLMEAAHLSAEIVEVDRLLGILELRRYSGEERARIRARAQVFAEDFGDTITGARYAPLVEALASLESRALITTETVHVRLKMANPHYNGQAKIELNEEGDVISIDLRGCGSVEAISRLEGLPLKYLILEDTRVADLLHLGGMPLSYLNIVGTPITDVRPLEGLSLSRFRFDPSRIHEGIDILRSMQSLRAISPGREAPWMDPVRFWQRFDGGEF
jgi:serine/threonine protein kinase